MSDVVTKVKEKCSVMTVTKKSEEKSVGRCHHGTRTKNTAILHNNNKSKLKQNSVELISGLRCRDADRRVAT